ncbi:unnamed protein product [Schistosoma margrebowiei]|uniref:Uncharacterized protein n=1 Tax=Schistosoma margrebowiei TaxID=48269 RepID=A0A183LVY9_9TREM|nr:unnamed protein product [Schistosoma margrebowiei]
MDFTGSHYAKPNRPYLHQQNFRRTIEDMRTRRGADVASDHHLMVAKTKLKLKKHRTTVSQ